MDLIREKLKLLTTEPGCYLMKDENDKIIYVGKAKNLKRRVSSYFNKEQIGKTKALVENIKNFEYIVTSTEVESLLLEINLIKKYMPKYNILLKDNKSYPYIEITNEKYPRLVISRPKKLKNHKGKLFGPYPNAAAARNIVELLNRIYPFRKCHTLGDKPCLYYQIGECLGYCKHDVPKERINEMISEVSSFLKGNYNEVRKKIKVNMMEASDNLNFERAIEYKKMLEYIDTILEKQKIIINDGINRDVINYYEKNGYISIQILHIKDGRITMRDKDIFALVDDTINTLTYFITYYYTCNDIPSEILIPDTLDYNLLSEACNAKFIIPLKGAKKDLVNMAYENAKIVLEEKFDLIAKDERRTFLANEKLGELLGIKNLSRIELFDNAHLFASYKVSGMVTYVNGKPSKKDYRKYKVESDSKDDYNMMKEVIYRRYFKVLHEKLEKPDLIIVDGSIIQINACKEVLNSLYLDIPVVGLKKDDKHSTNALIFNDKEITLEKTSDVFHLLSRMQDEVHRFTINFHKDIRSKGSLSSLLDTIPKIGDKRKKVLLKKYKTITKLKELTLEDLEQDLPKNAANNLYNFLLNYENK